MPTVRFQRNLIRPSSCRPYTEAWIHGTLAPFAEHYTRLMETPGADRDLVLRIAQDELLDMVYPFLRSEIRRLSRNLPSTADEHALEEAVFDGAMRAAASFTPEQFLTWPALLKAKLSVAPVEAARVDSRISRRHAKFSSTFRAAEELETQRIGRSLTRQERDALAEKVTPKTRRENWPQIVQQPVRVYQVEALADEGQTLIDFAGTDAADARLHAAELKAAFHAEVARLPANVQLAILDELGRIASGAEPRVSVIRRVEHHLPSSLRLYVV